MSRRSSHVRARPRRPVQSSGHQHGEDGEEMFDLAQAAKVLGRLQVALHYFTVGDRDGKTYAAHRAFPPQ